MDPAFLPAIEALESKLKILEDDLILKKKLINQLYEAAGEGPKYTDIQLTPSAKGASHAILEDQFFGQPLATSVKWILERRKASGLSAISLTELCDILKGGGYAFDNKDETIARRNVAITLGKNPSFMKVPGSNNIGLAEWYPNAKRKVSAAKPEDDGDDLHESPEKPEEVPAESNEVKDTP
jgi:hypothetical protein